MTVYVDDAHIPFGRMKMSHLWADTLDELFDMVDRIEVQRKWLQRPNACVTGESDLYDPDPRYATGMHASWVHFDVSDGKRMRAILYGAVQTDKFGPAEFLARRKLARVKELGPQMIAQAQLDRIFAARGRREGTQVLP